LKTTKKRLALNTCLIIKGCYTLKKQLKQTKGKNQMQSQSQVLEVYASEKDKNFLNYLIEGNASEKQIEKAIWDYVFDYKNHSLFFCLGWQGGTIHAIIKEVLKRQKTKDFLK
jgi:hypothetical protein